MRVMKQRGSSAGVAAAAIFSVAIAAAGCGAGTPQTDAGDHAAHDDHAAHEGAGAGAGVARVYFVEPRDGATVRTPIQFRFGSEQIMIMRIPEGEITAAEVRPGVAHYHLGLGRDCMPAGEVIPQGDPTWIHFGTGADSIEVEELAPGSHRFTVQAGDDLHRAIEGLCETITITVAS
jgi:hypothetical protein